MGSEVPSAERRDISDDGVDDVEVFDFPEGSEENDDQGDHPNGEGDDRVDNRQYVVGSELSVSLLVK